MRYELPLVTLAAWLAFISIPLSLGYIGLSWDALNHHIYLGWTAEQPRFDRDFWAASSQSYQFPYLYWPVYKLAVSGFSGVQAGVVLATLHLLAVPPVWMLARACMPGNTGFDFFMRAAAVAMAFLTGVVLSLLTATQNDLLAAIPLVWAIALSFPRGTPAPTSRLRPHQQTTLSGFLAGMSVAFKISNGPLALLMPVLWFVFAKGLKQRLLAVAIGCTATLAGYFLVYLPWGWQLWEHFGNPMYPFYESVFAPLRTALGWRQ